MANYFLSMLTLPFGSDSWRRHRRRSRSLHRNYVSSSGRKAAAPSSRAPFNGPPPAPRRADALSAPLPSGAARRAVNRFLFSYLDSSRTFRDTRASGHAGSGTTRCGGPRCFSGPEARARVPGSATAASTRGPVTATDSKRPRTCQSGAAIPATRTVCLPVLDWGLGCGLGYGLGYCQWLGYELGY